MHGIFLLVAADGKSFTQAEVLSRLSSRHEPRTLYEWVRAAGREQGLGNWTWIDLVAYLRELPTY